MPVKTNIVVTEWENDYEKTLRRGITVFRAYVEAWYDGSFQDIIFSPKQSPEIKAMICSLLAGYAWYLAKNSSHATTPTEARPSEKGISHHQT